MTRTRPSPSKPSPPSAGCPPPARPRTLYGCEVWRDLDWLVDADKVVLDVGRRISLAKKLIDVYDSQIEGGKNYRQASIARWMVNATYYQSHETDVFKRICYAMDLTPLILDDSLNPIDFVLGFSGASSRAPNRCSGKSPFLPKSPIKNRNRRAIPPAPASFP